MTSVITREETASTVARNAGMYWSSQFKALAVGRNRPSSQRQLYAGLVGLLTLKHHKDYELPHNGSLLQYVM